MKNIRSNGKIFGVVFFEIKKLINLIDQALFVGLTS